MKHFFPALACSAVFLLSLQAAGDPDPTVSTTEMTSVSQGGITWTFDAPVPVGQFVNGDYYVVGPCTITHISPEPVIATEDPRDSRNISILNPPPDQGKVSYDGRTMGGRAFDPSLAAPLPIAMKPGDILISSISGEGDKPRAGRCFMKIRSKISFTKSYSVLTCLDGPVPAGTFRPGFSDRTNTLYNIADIRWDRLRELPKVADTPDINEWAGIFRQPWAGAIRLCVANAQDYQPQYSVEAARAEAIASLLLNLDFTREEKMPLLVNFVQYGIDRYSLFRNGGLPERWTAVGGHGNGEKWGITFAGILLGDDKMANLNANYPEIRFGQDMQTAFVKDMPEGMQSCWNGSDVTYTGMYGLWDGEPTGKEPQHLPYEHERPADWVASTFTYGGNKTRTRFSGENYRRGQNSPAWVGIALAIRIMNAEEEYNHPAFCAYVDRWMTIDDAPLRKEITAAMAPDDTTDLENMPAGRAWDPFVEEMWDAYRGN